MADGETVGTRFTVPVEIELEADDIVEQLSIDQLVTLVVEIEQAASSWELTRRLAEYFNEEMRHLPEPAERGGPNDYKIAEETK